MTLRRQPGFIALISVILMSAVGFVLVAGLLTRANGSSKIGLDEDYALRARFAATACAEYALNQLKLSMTYAGNQDLRIGQDVCHILPPGGFGYVYRTVTATSSVMGANHTVYVDIRTVNPVMSIRSWQDLPN